MTTTDATTTAVDDMVNAMLQSYGQLALILDHMERHRTRASDPIPMVIRRIMRDTLVELPARAGGGADAVGAAARVLGAATEILGEEIILVEEPPPLSRRERRRRR